MIKATTKHVCTTENSFFSFDLRGTVKQLDETRSTTMVGLLEIYNLLANCGRKDEQEKSYLKNAFYLNFSLQVCNFERFSSKPPKK